MCSSDLAHPIVALPGSPAISAVRARLQSGSRKSHGLTVGKYNDTRVEIVSGPGAGTRVILYPSDHVVDGVNVSIR